MNLQQVVQPRSAANGFGRRWIEKDAGPRLEGKLQTGKANSSRSNVLGKDCGSESPSRERLVYLTTSLIGHHVEAQVLDGSIFSGMFHATNADKDFGIILKMAYLIKDGSQGQKNFSDGVSKPPLKTLIIPAEELVQVIAKGVSLTRDGLANELHHEKQQELLIDSYISQSRRLDNERGLERWVPDDDDPGCPELDDIFEGHWDRGWDQFEANETLFGVKSTFNEEIYTTKLDKGPQMKELEREALRIAREIEGEETQDLHLAEERGMKLHEKFDIDEETRFSSVFRGVDDSGYNDDILYMQNDDTIGGGFSSVVGNSYTDLSSVQPYDGVPESARPSSADEVQSSINRELYQSSADDCIRQLSAGQPSKSILPFGDNRAYENLSAEHAVSSYPEEDAGNAALFEEAQTSKPDDSRSSVWPKRESSEKGGLSANATAYAPSCVPTKVQEKTNSTNEVSDGIRPSKVQGAAQSSSSRVRPGSAASSTSDRGGGPSASGGRGLSPSSSVGSLSSEKSTLNPNAKEFKLNPNAKSFVPSQTPLRPTSPVPDGSYYYPANMATVPHMPGIGIGPSFPAQQPVIFNPHTSPAPQPYFHPNGPQYGHQMMIGHPRQVFYMPTYTSEIPYKGRDF